MEKGEEDEYDNNMKNVGVRYSVKLDYYDEEKENYIPLQLCCFVSYIMGGRGGSSDAIRMEISVAVEFTGGMCDV